MSLRNDTGVGLEDWCLPLRATLVELDYAFSTPPVLDSDMLTLARMDALHTLNLRGAHKGLSAVSLLAFGTYV